MCERSEKEVVVVVAPPPLPFRSLPTQFQKKKNCSNRMLYNYSLALARMLYVWKTLCGYFFFNRVMLMAITIRRRVAVHAFVIHLFLLRNRLL